MRNFITLILLLSLTQVSGQDTLRLTFLGDIMQHGPQIRSAYDPVLKKYVYDSCFKYIKDELSSADITIGNLETTLAGSPYKGYPLFSAPDQLAEALQNSGVDVLVTANNHTCDRRKKGIIRTLDVLDTLDIPHTGSFRNQKEKDNNYPLLIEKQGIKLALLNYTYGTNGMPVDEPTRVNLFEKDSILSDLKKARAMNVDQIIVFVHWGSEYTHTPNAFQKSWKKTLLENGADIVIGAHPHVVQPMVFEPADSVKDARIVAYSLGNFVSNQRTAPRDGGALFNLTLVKVGDNVKITEAGYVLTWVWLPIRNGKRHYFVLPASKYEDDRGMVDEWSHKKMKAYMKTARKVFADKNKNVPEYKFINQKWTLKKLE